MVLPQRETIESESIKVGKRLKALGQKNDRLVVEHDRRKQLACWPGRPHRNLVPGGSRRASCCAGTVKEFLQIWQGTCKGRNL